MYFDYSTYPFKNEPPSYGAPFSLYIEEIETIYKLATEEQKLAWKDENIPLYSTPSYVRVLYDAIPETTTD